MSDDERKPYDSDDGEGGKSDLKVSYTYWDRKVKDVPAAHATIAPVRLESQVEAKHDPNQGSAWNTAGTWEERNITSHMKRRLEETLVGLDVEFAHGDLRTSELSKCDGEASVCFVRGKKRLGYEFQLKVKVDGTVIQADGETRVCGYVSLEDVSDHSGGDYDVTVTVEGSRPADGLCKSSLTAFVPRLKQHIQKVVEETKNAC
eukprot:GILJ01001488.1.p1 GENE.GILJ01001488.1~~GILJ01001488.1.p1  ORF type:complete len:204 (-),score=35.30 GILJ01001488.1:224-835(-)